MYQMYYYVTLYFTIIFSSKYQYLYQKNSVAIQTDIGLPTFTATVCNN